MKIKLAAIAKDEGAYIARWIHHHLFFGFDSIEIWLNGTSDNSLAILKKISLNHKNVHYKTADNLLNYCIKNNKNFQHACYNNIFVNLIVDEQHTHVMFLDLDELWTPKDLSSTIKKSIGEYPDADSISFMWYLDMPDVSKSIFTKSINPINKLQKNPFVKSALKVSPRVSGISYHNHKIEEGIYILSDGTLFPVRNFDSRNPGSIKGRVSNDYFSLNKDRIDQYFIYHEVYRSEIEYLASLYRGRQHQQDDSLLKRNRIGYLPDPISHPDIIWEVDNNSLLKYNDSLARFIQTNDLRDDIIIAEINLQKRAEKVINLRKTDKLFHADCSIIFQGTRLAQTLNEDIANKQLKENAKKRAEKPSSSLGSSKDGHLGWVDSILLVDEYLIIRGWAIDSQGNAAKEFKVYQGETELTIHLIKSVSRYDVNKSILKASIQCGFEILISKRSIHPQLNLQSLTVFTHVTQENERYRLKINPNIKITRAIYSTTCTDNSNNTRLSIRDVNITSSINIQLCIFTNSIFHEPEKSPIFKTYRSFCETFGKITPIVYHDPHPLTSLSEQYQIELEKIFPIVHQTKSLSDGYIRAVEESSADYIFMLEHDWIFIRTLPSLQYLCNIIKLNDLFHLRFNKRKNTVAGWDTNISQHEGYILTDCVSNNPHIIHRQRWLSRARHYVRVLSGSLGIEAELTAASELRGAIYGSIGDEAAIQHINTRAIVWNNSNIKDTPFMEEEGIILLGDLLQKIATYLEYGAGGSTIFAAKKGVKTIHSVESDMLLMKALSDRFSENFNDINYIGHYANIGPTTGFGYPSSKDDHDKWIHYPLAPWAKIGRDGNFPNLILIDGRFRVACFLASILFSTEGTTILFDDYADRKFYHVIEKYLSPQKLAGRMAEFVTKPLKHPSESVQIWADLVAHSHDPR